MFALTGVSIFLAPVLKVRSAFWGWLNEGSWC